MIQLFLFSRVVFCQSGDASVRKQEGLRGGKVFFLPCYHFCIYCWLFCRLFTVSICCFLHQWISTINNISKRIYLSENAEVRVLLPSLAFIFLVPEIFSFWLMLTVLSSHCQELAARVNQSALEAVTPSPSFQQRHESMRPSRFVSDVCG